jgi:glucokinase
MFADLRLPDLDRSAGAAAIGIDVGGTKTALGLIDAASLTLLATDVIPTGRERGGEAVLRDIEKHAAALAQAATELGRHTVGLGVAVPEIVNLDGRITSSAVIPRWNELPVAMVLGAIAPAVVEADVRAAAFAEASLGAGRDYGFHVFLTVGTGISYCAVGAGRPFAGAHGGALNIGTSVLALPSEDQTSLDGQPGADDQASADSRIWVNGWPSADGYPGGREVVLERVASGSALVQRYVARGGTAQRAEDVLTAARDGDLAASEVVDVAAKALGIGIALLVNLLDPEAVITGGGLGSADTEYWTAAERWARHYAHSHATDTVLTRGQLGPDAGVIGAGLVGLLARHRLQHRAKTHDGTGRGATNRGTGRDSPSRGNADCGIPNSSSEKRK